MYNLITRDLFNNLDNMFLPRTGSHPRDFPEVREDEAGYTINVDMPGIPPENVNVSLEGNVLSIEGKSSDEERGNYKKRQFRRSWRVGTDVLTDAISARSEHGVLTLTLPKQEKARPKEIPIST